MSRPKPKKRDPKSQGKSRRKQKLVVAVSPKEKERLAAEAANRRANIRFAILLAVALTAFLVLGWLTSSQWAKGLLPPVKNENSNQAGDNQSEPADNTTTNAGTPTGSNTGTGDNAATNDNEGGGE